MTVTNTMGAAELLRKYLESPAGSDRLVGAEDGSSLGESCFTLCGATSCAPPLDVRARALGLRAGELV